MFYLFLYIGMLQLLIQDNHAAIFQLSRCMALYKLLHSLTDENDALLSLVHFDSLLWQ